MTVLPALLIASLFGAAPPRSGLERSLDRVVHAHTREIGKSAVAVVVLRRGKRIYRKVVGQADIRSGVEATPETNFRLASITKTMTAAAVLYLVEKGQVSLKARLSTLLPKMPAWARKVRLVHLLSHTSGLKRFRAPKGHRGQVSDADVVASLRTQDGTYFEPGSKFRYCNEAYAVLAEVVEKVSGMSFPQFLGKRVFRPLGMTSTRAFVAPGDDIPNRAFGTKLKKDGEWKLHDQGKTTAILGDGGVYSNLEDMERWMRTVSSGRFLSRSSWTRALTAYPTQRGRKEHLYGMGFNVTPWRKYPAVSHSGTTLGFRNYYLSVPERGFDVLVLTNVHLFDAYKLASEVMATALKKPR